MSILPESFLISELKRKSEEVEKNIKFDYIGKLKSLKGTVTQQVSHVNVLFPEYTPHDNEYHFKNLFNITDDILGKKIIEKLNVNELFILASALYAHDWGMAVSPSEKNIIMGNNTTNTVPENIILLQDETQSFQDFLKDQDYKGKPDEVSDDLWREYVRKTHALRSGVRVNHFFKENSGLAEAVKRACEGHWLNFQDIRNNNIYPRDYSVLFSIVNLRAISIYVRLIDLLDISEDRTPYVLWKFVSPENEFSNNEWLKHRALSSVKSTDYLGTRIIKIDGKTEDHEVYASLQDLKQWCDDQFRDCIDVLAEMNDTNHILDISHIHWNIVTAGFEPSSIKFNFDRERLFEILGEQIYGDDPYVFLRELLQNSVDALKLRQAILAKRGMTLNDGFIKVEVKKVNENELIIVWTDNGVGMNEYIIGNYLSIAGKSFYSSKDFDKIGIKMDVISKFGIGILSCFTLAEKIEITTYREPYIEPNSKLINISIPAYNKYFRISSKTPQLYEDVKPGTTFKIFISSKKNTNQNDNSPRLKSVYQYLSKIAGFVEFPILVEEKNMKKLIIHPNVCKGRNFEQIKLKYSDYEVEYIDLSYNKSVFLPQDIRHVKEFFSEEAFSLEEDIGIDGIEGVISFIVPKEEKGNFIYEDYHGTWIEEEPNTERRLSLRVDGNKNIMEISTSCRIDPTCSVYKDGILVSDVIDYGDFKPGTIKPRIIINVKDPKNEINISRTFFTKKEDISERVTHKVWDFLIQRYLTEFRKTDPLSAYKLLGKIITVYGVSGKYILERVPANKLFQPILGMRGKYIFLSLEELKGQPVYDLLGMSSEMDSTWLKNIGSTRNYRGGYNSWIGENILITDNEYGTNYYTRKNVDFLNKFINDNYFCAQVDFIDFGFDNIMPLMQRKWVLNSNFYDELSNNQFNDVLMKMKEMETELSQKEMYIFHKYISNIDRRINAIGKFRFYYFNSFKEKFAYGAYAYNLSNMKCRKFLSILAHILLICQSKDISQEKLGMINDNIENITFLYREDIIEYKEMNYGWKEFLNSLNTMSMLNFEIEEIMPSEEEFVEGSIGKGDSRAFTIDDYLWKRKRDGLNEEELPDFGEIVHD